MEDSDSSACRYKFIFRFYYLCFIPVIFSLINSISFKENLSSLCSLERWLPALTLLGQFLFFPGLLNCILVNFLYSSDSRGINWRSLQLETTSKTFNIFFSRKIYSSIFHIFLWLVCFLWNPIRNTLWSSLMFTPCTPAFTVLYLQ